jgi:8-oxo-dGTP diphosphatase
MIFFDRANRRALIYRRDDKPNIPFPNMLDLIGGEVEPGETLEAAMVREVAEELLDRRTGMPYRLEAFQLFKSVEDRERDVTDHVFWTETDCAIEDVELLEGQHLVWINHADVQTTVMACGFSAVLEDFFRSIPA